MASSIMYILMYAAFNVTGAAVIKWQLRNRSLSSLREWIQFLLNIPFFIAFTLIVLSALTLFKALSTSSFSVVIPIATGVNFILTVLVGYYLFQDKLSLVSLLGFVLILGGVIILSFNNQAHAQ